MLSQYLTCLQSLYLDTVNIPAMMPGTLLAIYVTISVSLFVSLSVYLWQLVSAIVKMYKTGHNAYKEMQKWTKIEKNKDMHKVIVLKGEAQY